MSEALRVVIWNECRHEQQDEAVRAVYPDGIHKALERGLNEYPGFSIRTATLDEPEHGLTEPVLEETDVLIWWGHKAHGEVADAVAERVRKHVLEGMGLIVLHSSHWAKVFRLLMGTTCSLKWREAGERERIWNLAPSHPITDGIDDYFEIEQEEMYGERFDIPEPDRLIFLSWFQGGEVFRSGCVWERGHGRIFYFRPGHETYPTYRHKDVLRVIANAARWAKPQVRLESQCPMTEPLEELPPRPCR